MYSLINFDKYMYTYSCKHCQNQDIKYFHYPKAFFPCPPLVSLFNLFCSLIQTYWLSQCWISVFFPQYTILSNPVISLSLYIVFQVIFVNLLFKSLIWFMPTFSLFFTTFNIILSSTLALPVSLKVFYSS